MKVIISGGGTGGHVFPAIAIADAIKATVPEASILFVGAKGKLEMEKVPQAGYPIKGLWISGFQRKITLRNLLFPVKLVWSLFRAFWILKRFKPDIVVGVGGYASGAVLKVAAWLNIPIVIQEQNSFAGVTNRLLAKQAAKIFVAYDNVRRFFPKEKIIPTGNPVRQDLAQNTNSKSDALTHWGFVASKKTLLILGGSLGARTLNESVAKHLDALKQADIQVIWQVGRLYEEEFAPRVAENPQILAVSFIERMDYAYAAADVVISRAGALSISELCVLGKASILVPSPHVAEDHQTANAMELVEKKAACLIRDNKARDTLIPEALALLENTPRQEKLEQTIKTLARPNAAQHIAQEILACIKP